MNTPDFFVAEGNIPHAYTSSTTSWSPRCLRSKLDVVATRQQFSPLEKAWFVRTSRSLVGTGPKELRAILSANRLRFVGGRSVYAARRLQPFHHFVVPLPLHRGGLVCANTTNKPPYCVIPSEPIEASRVDLDERNKARGAV